MHSKELCLTLFIYQESKVWQLRPVCPVAPQKKLNRTFFKFYNLNGALSVV